MDRILKFYSLNNFIYNTIHIQIHFILFILLSTVKDFDVNLILLYENIILCTYLLFFFVEYIFALEMNLLLNISCIKNIAIKGVELSDNGCMHDVRGGKDFVKNF